MFSVDFGTGVSIGYGCSVCGCSLSSDWAAQGYGSVPGWEASLRYEYSKSSQLRSGGGAISSAAETQQSTFNRAAILGLDYASAGAWGLAVEHAYRHVRLGDGGPAAGERENFMPSASLTVNAGVRLLTTGWLTPQLQVNTRFDARERGDKGDAANSRGMFVYLSPGVTAEIGEHASAFAFFQVPVYQYANGVQLEPRCLLSLGVRYKL